MGSHEQFTLGFRDGSMKSRVGVIWQGDRKLLWRGDTDWLEINKRRAGDGNVGIRYMSSRARVDRRKFHWQGSTDRLGIGRARTSDGNVGLDSDVASGARLSSWFPVCAFETLQYSWGGKREG